MYELKMAPQQVIETVNRLGGQKMRANSHGSELYLGMLIRDAARAQIAKTLGEKNAAIALMGVVLGANRNWQKVVQPNLEKLNKKYPLLTFDELRQLMSKNNWNEFREIWGHRDENKYRVLGALLTQILEFGKQHPHANDLELARAWVKTFDLEMLDAAHPLHKHYPGSIKSVGIATFQHLRLTFGVDTVKPDKRVKQVLQREFGEKLSDANAIRAVEAIAKITGLAVVMIDQIFVKYGSGYYVGSSDESSMAHDRSCTF